ncbi:hypothetical protein [Methylocystis sp. SC2]|nr:hypothetical protein [Methylocystis sp. SC2]
MTTAVNILALIGGLWVGAKAVGFLRWRCFINRDGSSGRSGRHWSQER